MSILPYKIDGQNADGTFDGFEDAPEVVLLYNSQSEAITVGDVAVLDLADTTYGAGKSVRNAVGAAGAGVANLDPRAVGFYMESRTTSDAAGFIAVQTGGIYNAALNDSGATIAVGEMLGVDVAGSQIATRSGVARLTAVTVTQWPFCIALTGADTTAGPTTPLTIEVGIMGARGGWYRGL